MEFRRTYAPLDNEMLWYCCRSLKTYVKEFCYPYPWKANKETFYGIRGVPNNEIRCYHDFLSADRELVFFSSYYNSFLISGLCVKGKPLVLKSFEYVHEPQNSLSY